MEKKKENIIFFCAHNDDQIIGAGGTVARYANEGKNVYTVIFSHGEKSHPWLKPEHAIETRIKEADSSNRILGGHDIVFLDLKEGKFLEQYEENKMEGGLIHTISKIKPSKIFFHGIDDPHPDHRAVHKLVSSLLDKIEFKGDAYTFDVWTIWNWRKTNYPKMAVDISDTFKTKLAAFKVHKSQKIAIFSLLWSIYFKAFMNGLNNRCTYAEVFHKVK